MIRWKTRCAVILAGMAMTLFGAPKESKAIFDWLCPSSWHQTRSTATTTYAPPYVAQPVAVAPRYTVAPAVAALPAPTTCAYVPQTCYRTVLRPVTVTAYRPVVARDACTGCPVTAYRPVTTIAQRAMMVPYTTYRPVCTTACAPTACAPTMCAPSGCSSCAPATAAPLSPIPMPTMPTSPGLPQPTYSAPLSGGSMGAPTLPLSSSLPATSGVPPASPTPPGGNFNYPSQPGVGGPQRTFGSGSGAGGSVQPSQAPYGGQTPNPGLKPTPDRSTGPASNGLFRYLTPPTQDGRTALVPVRQATYSVPVTPASYQPAAPQSSAASPKPFRPGIDDWEPVRRPNR